MSLRSANEIDAAYRKQLAIFEQEHEMLLRILSGTPLRQDMEVLKDAVDSAFALNVQAGWVSENGGFDRLEYFEAIIRQDYRGRLVRDRSAIPSDLRGEFEELDEADFAGYMAELREECRYAYDEMREVRSDLKHNLGGSVFLDELYSMPEEVGASAAEIKGVQALVENIEGLLAEHEKLARSLLHMANELGDCDYDPSLMEALLFD